MAGWWTSFHDVPTSGPVRFTSVLDPAPNAAAAQAYEAIGRDAPRMNAAEDGGNSTMNPDAGHVAGPETRLGPACRPLVARLAAANQTPGWQPRFALDPTPDSPIELGLGAGQDDLLRKRTGRAGLGLRAVMLAGMADARAGRISGALAAAAALAGTARRLQGSPGDAQEVHDLGSVAATNMDFVLGSFAPNVPWPDAGRTALRASLGSRPGPDAFRAHCADGYQMAGLSIGLYELAADWRELDTQLEALRAQVRSH